MPPEAATAVPVAEPALTEPTAPAAQPSSRTPDQPFGVGVVAGPETTQPEPPETKEPEKPAAPEASKPKGFDELSDEEKAAHPWVKDHAARLAESERRRAEREGVEAQARIRREYTASEQFVRDFEGEAIRAASDLDETGRPKLNRESVDKMFHHLLSAGAETSVSSIGALLAQEVGTDFKPTDEETRLLAAAKQEFDANPVKGAASLVREWLHMRDRVVLEKASESRFEEGRKAGVKEAEARFEEERAREGRESTRNAPGPTPVEGTRVTAAAHDTSTLVGLGKALFDGAQIPDDELFKRLAG